MPEVSWWQIIPSFIGGGLAGAIVTQSVTWWRGRLQPIGYSIESEVFLNRMPVGSSVSAYITIVPTGDGDPEVFENIAVAELLITNRGNKDYGTFKFGLTMADENPAIVTECIGEDRHHSMVCIDGPTIRERKNELNFTLTPFNRKDVYRAKIYVELPAGSDGPRKILVGSQEVGVRLMPIPAITDLLRQSLVHSFRVGRFVIGSR